MAPIMQLITFLATGVLTAAQGPFHTTYSPVPTPAPTHCECLDYNAANATDIAADGLSCLYCSTCSAGHCTCLSQDDCKALAEAVKSLFGYIAAAIGVAIVLACAGCIWRCCIRPRIKSKIMGDQHYHLNAVQAEPECHHQTVVMAQPTPVMVDQHGHPVHTVHVQAQPTPVMVDQYGHPVQTVHVQAVQHHHQPVVATHVVTHATHPAHHHH